MKSLTHLFSALVISLLVSTAPTVADDKTPGGCPGILEGPQAAIIDLDEIDSGTNIMEIARKIALSQGHSQITAAHFLLASIIRFNAELLEEGRLGGIPKKVQVIVEKLQLDDGNIFAKLLNEGKITLDQFKALIQALVDIINGMSGVKGQTLPEELQSQLSEELVTILERAREFAESSGGSKAGKVEIQMKHVIAATFESQSKSGELLNEKTFFGKKPKYGITKESVLNFDESAAPASTGGSSVATTPVPVRPTPLAPQRPAPSPGQSQPSSNPSEPGESSSLLVDLTTQARRGELGAHFENPSYSLVEGDLAAGHSVLARSKSGAAFLPMGIAQRIVSGTTHPNLKEATLLRLDLSSLLGNQDNAHQGNLEGLIRGALDEVAQRRARGDNVILVIPNLDMLGDLDKRVSSTRVLSFLKDYAESGKVVILGLASEDYYQQQIAKQPIRFEFNKPIDVKEPQREDLIAALESYWKSKHEPAGYAAEGGLFETIVDVGTKYQSDYERMPDGLFRALDITVTLASANRHQLTSMVKETLSKAHSFIDKLASDRLAEATRRSLKTELSKLKEELSFRIDQFALVQSPNEALDKLKGLQRYLKEVVSPLTTRNSPQDQEKIEFTKQHIEHTQREISALESAIPEIGNPDELQNAIPVSAREAREVFETRYSLNTQTISAGNADVLSNHAARLSEVVIGQDSAARSIQKGLILAAGPFGDKSKPDTYLACGPSGVGKTEMIKQSTTILHGSEDAFLKIDCGEYSAEIDAKKLTGSAPGFVGHGEESPIIKFLKANPTGDLLFDEIEKADKAVVLAIIGLLDTGVFAGLKFRGRIFITSNVGRALMAEKGKYMHAFFFGPDSEHYHADSPKRPREAFTAAERKEFASLGKPLRDGTIQYEEELLSEDFDPMDEKNAHIVNSLTDEQIKMLLVKEFKAFEIPPEILGRIRTLMVFNVLNEETLSKIVDLQVHKFIREGFQRAGLDSDIEITARAKKEIVRRGTSKDTGARNLYSILIRDVITELSEIFTTGTGVRSGQSVVVDFKDGAFRFAVVDNRLFNAARENAITSGNQDDFADSLPSEGVLWQAKEWD